MSEMHAATISCDHNVKRTHAHVQRACLTGVCVPNSAHVHVRALGTRTQGSISKAAGLLVSAASKDRRDPNQHQLAKDLSLCGTSAGITLQEEADH